MAGVDFKFDSDKLAAASSRAMLTPKEYSIELKPISSALKDALGLTLLKSLRNFLRLPNSARDFIVALWNATKCALSEIIRVTTTQILKRLAVLCFSPRIAWKLVRDVSASIARLAAKRVSGFNFIFRAAKKTFLGNAIATLASWLVQVGLHICDFIYGFFVSEKSGTWERIWILGKRVLGTSVKCVISFILACACAAIVALVFGWIGTWIGAFTLPCFLAGVLAKIFCPPVGLLIGFGAGDFVGDALISLFSKKFGF